MPIHGYPGGVITANPVAPTSSVATGVWTTEQQLIAKAAGNWPFAAQQISRSLRFNSPDTTYLNRTPASATNQKTWTWSAWVKRSVLGATKVLFDARGAGSNPVHAFYFNSSDQLAVFIRNASATVIGNYNTSAVFRDLSAWYYITYKFDSTQATATNRVEIYVNGVLQVITASTTISQNADAFINSAISHGIGAEGVTPTDEFDGYLTEINFIDGQALTPASFGRTNTDTGVWEPIAYSGTYGTNGFYLNFSDNSNTTATTLGKDYSGNGNNWTPNNFSVTPGNGNDSLVDTPTAYGTDTGVGGEVRGNYCTLNPLLFRYSVGAGTLSNGNLQATGSSTYFYSTFQMPATGKWYFEGVPTAGSSTPGIGLGGLESASSVFTNQVQYLSNGNKDVNNSQTAYGASYTSSDVIGVAVDCDAGTITFYKNNVSQGAITTTVRNQFVFLQTGASWLWIMNFGQRPFTYTAPSNHKALCTQNLPTPTIGATNTTQANDYFDATLYAGNNTAGRNVTNSGSFQPDFVWIKNRSGANNHILTDAVRGATKTLISDATNAEVTATGALTAFNSNGFQVGYDGTAIVNATGSNYVGWQWKSGNSNNINTAGVITTTVRVNTTSGFSIVTYDGNALNGSTAGHGLGVTPKMIIAKNRTTATEWPVYHSSLTASNLIFLNQTAGQATIASSTGGGIGAVSATTFTCTTGTNLNNINKLNDQYVAYCFAEVAGYSSFGSYTGNGSADGPFIYTGFRPAFVMVKNLTTAATSNWVMKDDLRAASYNPATGNLYANLNFAEDVTATVEIDLLSNGFKARGTYAGINGSGNSIIYAAFAEFPFKYSLAR